MTAMTTATFAPAAALTMLSVQRGWRVADYRLRQRCARLPRAALMGAEVDAIDISPAMLALANIQAPRPQGRDPDPARRTPELCLPAEFV